jgi:putative ABC transport system permease protein
LVYHFQWKEGSGATLRALGAHGALIDDSMASNHRLHVGSVLRVTTTAGVHDSFRVAGIYKQSDLLPDWVIRFDTMAADWRLRTVDVILANAASGQNLVALKARIAHALSSRYPTAAVHSQQDLKNQDTQSIDLLVNLVYVLLAMSVLVSLFGIINTLVLSIYERTREIGMLRAIGTTRGQVRAVVLWESVNTSVIGAILGLILGAILAMLVTAGLQSQGLEYALPVGNLLVWLVFAVIFGMIAAAWPAWRAARLDLLRAIAYE